MTHTYDPRIAVYPGTFDPMTSGHVDLIKRAAPLFERLIVGVADNPAKGPGFNLEERIAMARAAIDGIPNIEVRGFNELLAQFVRKVNAKVVLRGGKKTAVPGGQLTSGGGVNDPILKKLPRFKEALDTWFPVPAATAWIGLSPPAARIFMHVDNTQHWDEHHRVHLPLATNSEARLCVRGRFAHMPASTIWAINNSAPHGAINGGRFDRLHLMVDLPSTPEVEAWMAEGEPRHGVTDESVMIELSQDPFVALSPAERANRALMARLDRQ